MITVDKSGNGDFTTIDEAPASIENDTNPVEIFIKSGTYKERIKITRLKENVFYGLGMF